MPSQMKADIIIVGAGACGLMAARELSKLGKKVIILEARDRIGGRIFPLDEKDWGFSAQAGAEYVHGKAPITKELVKEAGVTLVKTEGDMWSSRDGEVTINNERIPDQDELHAKLRELKEDLSIADFLNKYFSEEKYARLRNSITMMVEGYDAADPKRIGTLDLREEWLGGGEWLQYRIKEGYGALLKFLKTEIKKNGSEIYLDKQVKEIELKNEGVFVKCGDRSDYHAEKIIVTVPLPIIESIKFIPSIPEKLKIISKMGYGGAIKILLCFKDRWWLNAFGKDFSEMDFMLSNEEFHAWWTQYPEKYPVLVGWMAGPRVEKYKNAADKEILDIGFTALSNIFKVGKNFLEKQTLNSKVANWPSDPFAKGAYSYTTPESEKARQEIIKPIENKFFFAGEALCSSNNSSTVEGALFSGKETAEKIIGLA